jgi:hypothetical protein
MPTPLMGPAVTTATAAPTRTLARAAHACRATTSAAKVAPVVREAAMPAAVAVVRQTPVTAPAAVAYREMRHRSATTAGSYSLLALRSCCDDAMPFDWLAHANSA